MLTSSLAILMSSVTSLKTVGSMKYPVSPIFLPPVTSFAPSFFPLSISSRILFCCSKSIWNQSMYLCTKHVNILYIINTHIHTIYLSELIVLCIHLGILENFSLVITTKKVYHNFFCSNIYIYIYCHCQYCFYVSAVSCLEI